MSISNRMNTSIDIPVPRNKRHPIWLYYVERTNIVNAFRALFRSYLISDKDMTLYPVEDKELSDLLMETLNTVYPYERSTIGRELGIEQLRWNIYQRVFGYDDKTKAFPRSPTFNSDYHALQESIFLNIARAIWTKESTFQKIMDPASLSEMLTNMREILLAKQTNYVNDLTAFWSMGFSRLRGLLDNPRLIRDKLGIRVIGEDQILMALGAKLNVPVPRNILYILDLAERMETILLRIERTHWNINQAEAWYASENFWKLTFNAYNRVWGRDFMQMAVLSLPSAARARM
jgi:hypothetical protein